MNLIFANNYFYIRGGSERVYFDEMNLLRNSGISVSPLSYFDSEVCVDSISKDAVLLDVPRNSFKRKAANFKNLFYNKKAFKALDNMLKNNNYDILHSHNIYSRLSMSIVDCAHRHKIKNIITLHDFKYICPHYTMLKNFNICERCKNGKYYKAFFNKCHKNSLAASALVAMELYFFKYMNIYEKVDVFISPSKFLKEKYTEMGFNGEITYIPNFIDSDVYNPIDDKRLTKADNYYLFVGRLSVEKGLFNLLKAFKKNNHRLIVIGDGPLKTSIQEYIEVNNLSNRIEMVGYLASKDVFNYVKKCKALIVPSTWYENAPINILESLLFGVPVLASEIGGIPEMIHDNKNGFLFKFDDIDSINTAIEKCESLSDHDRIQFRDYSQHLVNTVFSKKNHYELLLQTYNKVLAV